MKKYTYNQFNFYEFCSDSNLKKISSDPIYWRTYYISGNTNLIKFFPFSEYHGGGQPYLIEIGNVDFEIWINQYPNFENEIRSILDKK
jgi:hypothetical protein